MFRELFSIAIYNLSQRRLRTFLTILGIIIGVASIVGIISLGNSMEESIYKQLVKIGGDVINIIPINIKVGGMLHGFSVRMELTSSDLKEISKIDGVEQIFALIRVGSKVEYDKEEIILSINGVENLKAWEKVEAERFGLEKGKFISDEDKYSAVIGYSVAHEIFSKNVELNKKIKINGVEFKVVGILNRIGGTLAALDQYIYIPIKTARELFGEKFGEDEYSMIIAKVAKGYNANEVAEKINEKLLTLHKQTEDTKTFTVTSPKFFQETVGSVMDTLTIFLGAIAAISLIVSGIGIANIMYVSVMERTREIGVMKAIGATNRTILLLFLLESSIIGLIGGLLGDVIGVIFSHGLGFGVTRGFEIGERLSISIIIRPEILLLGCLFGLGVGAIAGYFPAKRAASLQPVEALRYE